MPTYRLAPMMRYRIRRNFSMTIICDRHNKKQTISTSGCGPTSMAMVISSLTDYDVTPIDMASFSVENGYRTEDQGTSWSFFGAAAEFNFYNYQLLNII